MEFPHVDLPVDLIAWTDVTEDILNIYKQSCRLKACIFALCTEGSITVSILSLIHIYQDTGNNSRYQKGKNNKNEVHDNNCCLVISG